MKLSVAACALLVAASTASAQAPQMTPGEALLQQAHDRYVDTRFRTVSFVQRTTFPDGRIEWWYEAESIPGKARVDIAPFEDRSASIFRNDSAYIWRKGQLTKGAGLAATMWTLMDMYAVPVAETAAALKRRNFDLGRVHERTHDGRPVYVIGALADDTTSSQFWLDKEHLYTVKMIVTLPGGRRVTDIGKHIFQDGGWLEQEIRVTMNGKLILLEEYTETRTNVKLPDDFFDPVAYRPPHWVRSPGK